MFSREKGYKIRAKVHGKGGIFVTSRRAWLPLLKLIAVTGTFPGCRSNCHAASQRLLPASLLTAKPKSSAHNLCTSTVKILAKNLTQWPMYQFCVVIAIVW